MEFLTLVTVALALVPLICWLCKRGKGGEGGKLIPDLPAPTTLLLGHIPWLKEEARKNGGLRFMIFYKTFLQHRWPICKIRTGVLGGNSIIAFVSDSRLAEEIIKSKEFGLSGRTASYLTYIIGGPSLIALDGKVWKRHRRLMQPIFRKQQLDSAVQVINRHTNKCLDELESRPADGDSLDAVQVLNGLTMDIIAEVAYGYNMRLQTEEKQRAIRHALRASLDHFSKVILQPSVTIAKVFNWSAHREFLQQREFVVSELIYPILRKRRYESSAGEETPFDLLSLLLSAQDEEGENGDGFTETEVVREALLMFVAGFETMTGTLSWVFYYLAKHPEIQENIYKEVSSAISADSSLSLEDTGKLTYLAWVIKEAQRLSPVATFIARGARKDAVVQGYHIPAGTAIMISNYTIHHSPEEWDDPDEFRPKRWEKPDGGCKKASGFSFLAFGAGPRRCLGQPLAVPELKLITALWLSRFRLSLASEDLKPQMALTYFPGQLLLNLERR